MNKTDIELPRIGLALSGGAVRGMAHIGILQALEDNGIKPHCLAGTSVGALIATLYAFGMPVDKIQRLAADMKWLQISHFTLSRLGLLSNEEMGRLVETVIGKATIEEAIRPLAIVCTDISTGEKVVLRKGEAAKAVMASTCVPGIFIPVNLDDRLLVDGGLVEDVPISPLRPMGAEVIVAANLSAEAKYKSPEDIMDLIINAFDITIDLNIKHQIAEADVVIETKLAAYNRKDLHQFSALYAEGYQAASHSVEQIRLALQKHQQLRPSLWRRIKQTLFPARC